MLEIKLWDRLSPTEKNQILSRPLSNASKQSIVLDVINKVRTYGDKALLEFTQQFDGTTLTDLLVPKTKIQQASANPETVRAITSAIQSITTYNKAMLPESGYVSTAPGITIRTVYRPIQKVGLYIPGGNNTPLVSSLLMQAVPALVAGCPIKVLCTPPDKEGNINPNLLVAARLCGIDTIYTIGGAQAIAAMAYGTETVTKVDKIFGPGNSYVTEAKTCVASDPNGAAIDIPAGPSEVMVIADDQANPAFVAADLLAQAEHGVDSQSFLVCDSLQLANKVNQELAKQYSNLSRQSIIKQSLALSSIILCTDMQQQIDIINSYAPEHLIINRQDASSWVNQINTAGTVFLGSWAAETMGDYVTGSSHVLPTNGFAKSYSGLSITDFLRRFSVQSITQEGILHLGSAAITLAQIEGLDAHANAVQVRLNALGV